MLVLFTALNAYAAEKGIIRGKIVEEVGGLAIPFAVVSVFEATAEQPLQTIQTDESGIFKFINLKPGIYKVKVSYIGFTSLFVDDVT
ncbi:MAG: carboxypeptidase regulatory-like domain-containing protein, partial [Chitinophagaceae bacterium]